jgi:hypothetical protein
MTVISTSTRLGLQTKVAAVLTVLLAAFCVLTHPDRASAYLTALSLTTEDPSQIASFAVEKPAEVQISTIEFSAEETDTHLIGLAFRPQSEDLYAMGSGGTLYVLQGPPWHATPVNPTPAVSPLEGSVFALAFNPVKDMIVVIDDAGQDLLVNPFNGEVTSDGTLAFGASEPFAGVSPVPAAAAFIRAEPGLATTTMYVLDSATDSLAVQGPSRSADAGAGGTLHPLEPLGLDIASVGGFASPQTPYVNEDVALLQPVGGGPQLLCGINTETLYANGPQASCSPGRSVGAGQPLEGLAVVPPSVIRVADHVVEGSISQGAEVTVERRGGLKRSVAVEYFTPAPSIHGSMASGFVIPSGELTFKQGERTESFHVDIPHAPSAEELGGFVELRGSSPDTFVVEAAAHIVVRPEAPQGVQIQRPKTSLGRILRRHKLVVRYSCMHECGPVMKLGVSGIGISTFDPPGGPTAGIRAAVFELDGTARRAIVANTRHGAASFRLSAIFTDRSGDRLTRVLRFRLRR